jgi:hypothetical protein
MPLPLLAIGMGVSAFGSIMGGFAAADAQRNQASQARVAAVRARLKASDDARLIEEQGGRFQANQAVGFAKSGVMLDSGSPLAVLMDTAVHVERNAMKTRLSGEWGAGALDATASAYEKMADNSALAGIYGAAGSFLTGAKIEAEAYKPPKVTR